MVHHHCVDHQASSFSTINKLSHIENQLRDLLQDLDTIPSEHLDQMRRVKDSERRTRQREEKLREQQQKQKERMRRYLERSLEEPKKVLKKKPTPKFVPTVQKVPESKETGSRDEEETRRYLFPSDESD
uniref:Uncharacterized protein n=1 Tax=Knipowitschia caucasica TaxID=637954 RepID=A0AAV2MHE4_KNICA